MKENNLFELYYAGLATNNTTAMYRAVLNKECTVAEFLEEVTRRVTDQGSVYVLTNDQCVGQLLSSDVDYRYGKIIQDKLPMLKHASEVRKVVAFGDATTMNYYVYV